MRSTGWAVYFPIILVTPRCYRWQRKCKSIQKTLCLPETIVRHHNSRWKTIICRQTKSLLCTLTLLLTPNSCRWRRDNRKVHISSILYCLTCIHADQFRHMALLKTQMLGIRHMYCVARLFPSNKTFYSSKNPIDCIKVKSNRIDILTIRQTGTIGLVLASRKHIRGGD